MKFSILQQELSPVIQSVSRSVSSHATLPVLNNILISSEKGKLKIAATNLEIGIIKYLNADISEDGETTIPAKVFLELIQSLPASKLEFEVKQDIVSVSSGKFKASINGISANEFPAIPSSSEKGINFKTSILKSCEQILFASAIDDGRPTLTGILTFTKDGKLNFVATDGFRLAHREVSIEDHKLDFKSIIPKRTFEEILKVITEDSGEEVNISISGSSQAIFKINQTIISSRLIEGSFPAWEKIIPTEIQTRLVIEKEEFLKSLKLAAVFAKNEANIIVLNITKDKVTVSSESKQLGNQENEVEAQIEGGSLQIAFNARFLLDAISNLPSTQGMLEFSGSLSPCLIKPVGVEGLKFVLMPLKLN